MFMNSLKNQSNFAELLILPKKILEHLHTEGLSDFILNYLSGKRFFDLKKSAYLLDNPEFGCVKGVTGYCSEELGDQSSEDEDDWARASSIIEKILPQSFNKKVKSVSHKSLHASDDSKDEAVIKQLQEELAMSNPMIIKWRAKHGNNGILLCEAKADTLFSDEKKKILEFSASLLSLTHF